MILLGASGLGKWGNGSILPKEAMVAENRFVISNATMQANFWDVFVKCRDNGIKQIITIDMWKSDGHLVPSETQLRYTVKSIVDTLITNGIKRDKACFQLDNEPAKHGVPMGLYCVQANIIHSELNGLYDLYVGSDECTYTNWYENIVPNCSCEGIAFHLQNCALNCIGTDASCNFIKNLATQYGKKVTCSEGNYLDPSVEYSYNMIEYHISACKRINSLDYCVIFLELANQDKYKWLSFVYNNVVRSQYYDDYMQLIELEKQVEDDDMKLDKVYQNGSRGIGVRFIQMVLNEDIEPEPPLAVDGIWGPKTNAIVLAYQEKYDLAQYGGAIGPNTMQAMIKDYPAIWNKTEYLWAIGVR